MITYVISALIGGFATTLLQLLPVDSGLPSALMTALGQMAAYLHTYDYFFPVSYALGLVLVALTFETFLWSSKMIMWVIKIVADFL